MKFIEFIRAFVRPFIVYTGWGAVVYVGCTLAFKFSDKGMADMFVGALLGTVAATVAWYIRDRVKP